MDKMNGCHSQTTLKNRLRTSEEKERIHMHNAKNFYICAKPFNATNTWSFEVVIESMGQYGPPNYHEMRVPVQQKAKEVNR